MPRAVRTQLPSPLRTLREDGVFVAPAADNDRLRLREEYGVVDLFTETACEVHTPHVSNNVAFSSSFSQSTSLIIVSTDRTSLSSLSSSSSSSSLLLY